MSNPTIDKITNAEKSLKKMFKETPYLVKQNAMFVGVTALSGELIEILKDQQNKIDELVKAHHLICLRFDELKTDHHNLSLQVDDMESAQ